MDSGDNQAALACFEEACTVDGANASVHFCRAVALVKVQAPPMADLHLPLCQPHTANALVGCAQSCGVIMNASLCRNNSLSRAPDNSSAQMRSFVVVFEGFAW